LLKDIPVENCTKEIDGPLYDIFCEGRVCDPYFSAHNTSIERGIKGLKSGVFWNNLYPYFLDYGQYIAQSKDADHIEQMGRPTYNQIYADLTTAFTILIGIFFPSVTGECRLKIFVRRAAKKYTSIQTQFPFL
jgi:solute carrier family 12 (potassium/chloride transporter), member 4/6